MTSVFSPSFHVAAVPFVMSVVPLSLMETAAEDSAAVAVTVLVAFVVVAVYSVTPPSNDGSRLSAPIVSPDRALFKGLP